VEIMSTPTRAGHPIDDLLPAEIKGQPEGEWSVGGMVWNRNGPRCTSGGYIYSAAVSAARPQPDYTARVIPHRDGFSIPLEETRILWQR
jgi:hypothetical protein